MAGQRQSGSGREGHVKNLSNPAAPYTVLDILCITQYMVHRMQKPWSLEAQSVFENLRLELRRGSLILAVLGALRSERYGYTLRKTLEEHGMAIDEGTLYPLLRRLESQGLLESEWREEDKRKKRFYRLSRVGADVFERLMAEWQGIGEAIRHIDTEPPHGSR